MKEALDPEYASWMSPRKLRQLQNRDPLNSDVPGSTDPDRRGNVNVIVKVRIP